MFVLVYVIHCARIFCTKTAGYTLFHSFAVHHDIITSLFIQMHAQLDCFRNVKTYIKVYTKTLISSVMWLQPHVRTDS